ncbi:hypothetical protein FOPG_12924 [Fusarium oxysporum f. sp. conglutinans race 2 54008]|uniref:Uncharacterized protein n=1 Tax=Fusarium oxysporum f. sp. conglutinans race 2 54008 TaxID=1089457 RepID=X0HI62_FUSOX|nr:hypothetical protein FOPG_12924 [Fusarium oxysporum f. sp. conglutinans race 2 54008]
MGSRGLFSSACHSRASLRYFECRAVDVRSYGGMYRLPVQNRTRLWSQALFRHPSKAGSHPAGSR